ncbi:MAG: ATP-dependent helicase, partial [Opitutaceae bacterium]|nr:ATP-dependent helicase [Opitutaceae bacterium]
MFKKLISKLRAVLAPSPAEKAKKTPARSASSAPVGGEPRADHRPKGPRPPRMDRPRHEKSRREGGGGGEDRGGRREGGRGERPRDRVEKHEKPKTDHSYEHPRAEPIKPKVAVEIPPQDTAFTKLGLNDAIAFAVAEMGYQEPT